jgi:hypothetical protein
MAYFDEFDVDTSRADLLGAVRESDDGTSAPAVKHFFEGMDLPVPQKDEFYSATASRYLVFLNEYGIVLRFTPSKAVISFDNPHFIMPLFSHKVGNYQVDIDPGYHCPVTEEQKKKIYKMLGKRYGIIVEDGKAHNLCIVPQTDPPFPVMIDLDPYYVSQGKRPLFSLFNAMAGFIDIKSEETANPQIENYALLRDIMAQACPANGNEPDPKGIWDFKQTCKAFKEAGKLVTPWEDPQRSYHSTDRIALNYARRLG